MHFRENRRGIFRHAPELPMSIAFLAAYLEENGISTDCLDLAVFENPEDVLRKTITETRPKYIGITSLSAAMPSAALAASICREVLGDDPFLIMGGLHATSIKETFLQEFPQFDILVYGEGEITLVKLLKSLEQGLPLDNILGLGYRTNDRIFLNEPRPFVKDFDALPFPDRNKLPVDKYTPSLHTGNFYRLPSTGIISSRGCPYNCNYCSKGVWGRTIRFRSAERIYEEMVYCLENYGIRDFRFYDDAITLPNGPVHKLCDLIIKNKLKVTWNCYSRVNCVNPELLKKMKRAGCYHIKYGVEFGSENALKIANKKATLEQAENAVKWTKEAKIECKGNFFMGLPGETWEDCKATVNFAKKISPDLVSFGVFEFIPGSYFYKQLHGPNGQEVADSCLPREKLYNLAFNSHLEFYLRPAYLLQTVRRFFRNPVREIKKNLAGARELARFLFFRIKNRKSRSQKKADKTRRLPQKTEKKKAVGL